MAVAVAPTGIPERFTVIRPLGAGAFGSVSVVRDRERGLELALKRLERVDPSSIYRFKQEFRALTDVKHPNLVKLHELFSADSVWCFTMDLVEGVRFDAWVWGLENDPDALSRVPSTLPTGESTDPMLPMPGARARTSSSERGEGTRDTNVVDRRVNLKRVREALAQLAAGVLALHGAGILHRDLKPSNVLVARDGHVSILDFGMVATGVGDTHQSSDGAIVGTPAYMSPEQARGAPLTTASDWYTVGLMLYEAMTGHLPFSGTVTDMIAARASRDPLDPRALKNGLPEDLCDLCMRLLSRDPGKRPSGIEIARALGLDPAAFATSRQVLAGAFVGRNREAESLRKAFALSRAGKTVVAHVHGPSGHGKTTLIRRFLADLALHHEVVVLEGRCYERESMPFKAVDDLVDALGRYLRGLRPVEAAGFMPRDARALVRLFPALGRLELAADLQGRAPSSDPLELRRRAFAALREMLARISDARPVVLFLDDVHWGDSDSAALVRNLLAPPDVPPLLLIACYRGDAPEVNDLLRTLRSPQVADAAWETVDVPLGPLDKREARSLAVELLGDGDGAEAAANTIAEESGGSPLFVAELVRAVRAGLPKGEAPTLQIVVADRAAALPASARLVLELLACSDRPLESLELQRASDLAPPALGEAVDRLRDEQLVNITGNKGRNAFEIGHDKLRIAVRDRLSAEVVAERHLRLAHALAGSPDCDPEALAYHFEQGGDRAQAVSWNEKAADRAAEAVAFDHAARLYRRALAWAEPADQVRLQERLAHALGSAGRCAESAEAFLTLAQGNDGDQVREARRRAAEQYIRAGHVKEAYEVFGPLLAESGLANPRTPARALMLLLWRRAQLKFRGLGFAWREQPDIDVADLRRVDFCWVIGTGLAGIDLVRSAHYLTASLQLALKYGEPLRVVRSLSMFTIMKSLENAEGCALAGEIAGNVETVAEKLATPHAMGWARAAQTVVAWGNSDLGRCADLCEEARTKLRERSQETFREAGSLDVWFGLHAQFLMGKLDAVAARAPALVREAEARGDRYLLSTARAYALTLLLAAHNRVAEARAEADAAVAVWPEQAWYHQHWASMRAHCFLDLYQGQGAGLLKRTQDARPRMKRAMQLRIRTLRFELNYLEARGFLEAALEGARPLYECRREVEQRIAAMRAEKSGLAGAYAEVLEAGLIGVVRPGDTGAAFARAAEGFDSQGMPMHVAACLMRQGQVAGGPAGEKMNAEASVALSRHGVVAPPSFANLLVPRVRSGSAEPQRVTAR